MDDPKNFTDKRPATWIDQRAKELEQAVNQELVKRSPKHSRLTYDALVDEVVGKHLNAFWSYLVMTSISDPPQIVITKYNGQVDEA